MGRWASELHCLIHALPHCPIASVPHCPIALGYANADIQATRRRRCRCAGLGLATAEIAAQVAGQQVPPPPPPAQGAPAGEAGRGRAGGQGRGRGALGGAAAGFVLNPAFDTEAPQLPADLKAGGVLIFSKTNGYRDEPSIQASNAALAAIATMRGLPSFVTENGAVMNADHLAKFKLVIWNNASGDILNEEQRAAFKTVDRAGRLVRRHPRRRRRSRRQSRPHVARRLEVVRRYARRRAVCRPLRDRAGRHSHRGSQEPDHQGPAVHLETVGGVVRVREEPARKAGVSHSGDG